MTERRKHLVLIGVILAALGGVALLADAGMPNGFQTELLSASVAPHAEVMAPAIQDQLAQLGSRFRTR